MNAGAQVPAFMGGVLYSALRRVREGGECAGRASSVAVLRRLAGRAREMGITLGLEPVNRYESNLVDTGEQRSRRPGPDNIRLHLDSYHMNVEEGDVAGAIRRFRGRIGYVHVNESHRGHLGSGSLELLRRSSGRWSRRATGVRSRSRACLGRRRGSRHSPEALWRSRRRLSSEHRTISPPARAPSSRSRWRLPGRP